MHICLYMGWMPEYVEENVTTTMHKALIRTWERTLPPAAALSRLAVWAGAWKPTERGEIADLAQGVTDGGLRV